ncbi:MAG: major tail protein [Paraclostridium sordellii]
MAVEQVVKTRRMGCKDIYVALVTENTATSYKTDTPLKLGRAIGAKVTIKTNVEKTHSDDIVEEVFEIFESAEIEIESNKLSPEQKALLRGAKYENGFLINNINDKAAEIAIGWRARQTNGKYEFVWYYCGKFNQGFTEEYDTKGDKTKTQTAKLKGTFYGREVDDNYNTEVDETYLLEGHNDAKTAIQDWFSKVQEPIEKK